MAIILPLVAIGFTIVCVVCVFAAPTTLNYDGVNVPAGLSLTGFENWAGGPCRTRSSATSTTTDRSRSTSRAATGRAGRRRRRSSSHGLGGPPTTPQATPAQLKAQAVQIARQDYADYSTHFLYPSDSLMIKIGLWIELEATIGFIVGLGLGSLLGQRTVAVILMIVLELVLTPILVDPRIPHLINLQRAVVGSCHGPSGTGRAALAFGGGGGGGRVARRRSLLLPESTTVAVCVIVAWLVGWTVLGAWRMMTRDA